MRNLGDLRFEDVSAAWGLDQKGVSFGAAFGDLDGDGDLDLVYTNYHKGVTVLRNDCDTGHRVMIDLRGTVSNRFGVGATVRIESALGVQVRTLGLARGYLSSSEPMMHFGLGEDTVIKRLVVTWPSGQVQTFENLAVDQRYTITEPAGPAPAPIRRRPKPASAGQFAEVSRGTGPGRPFARGTGRRGVRAAAAAVPPQPARPGPRGRRSRRRRTRRCGGRRHDPGSAAHRCMTRAQGGLPAPSATGGRAGHGR